jgi:hypothetical protein
MRRGTRQEIHEYCHQAHSHSPRTGRGKFRRRLQAGSVDPACPVEKNEDIHGGMRGRGSFARDAPNLGRHPSKDLLGNAILCLQKFVLSNEFHADRFDSIARRLVDIARVGVGEKPKHIEHL